jgi:hypothetical protein
MKIRIRDFEIESRLEKTGVKFAEVEKLRGWNCFRAHSRDLYGNSLWRYDPSWKEKVFYNKFIVSVSRFVGNKKITKEFTLYDRAPDVDKNTLKELFFSVLQLGLRATHSFNDFCDIFDYPTDSKEALEEYKEYQKMLKELLDFGLTESELEDIYSMKKPRILVIPVSSPPSLKRTTLFEFSSTSLDQGVKVKNEVNKKCKI